MESEMDAGDDDPGNSVQEIIAIVENLKTGLPAQLRKHKNNDQLWSLHKVTSTQIGFLEHEQFGNTIHELRRNLRLLKEVEEEVRRHIHPLDKLLQKLQSTSSKIRLTIGMKEELDNINKIFNLMCQALPNKFRKPKGLDTEDGDGDYHNNGKAIVYLPGIHANDEYLKRLAVFRDVQGHFMELNTVRKICLLSFAVFPENQEVNRTMLMYWWIGEGILTCEVKPETLVKEILKDLADRKLIQPVEHNRKVEPNSYKMSPFVHSSVVLLFKEMGLFDIYRIGDKPTMHQSKLNKVCLVEGSSSQAEAKRMENVHHIETVFNVSERFPDFTSKWFSSTKQLKVLYLGRWERTQREIEVDSRRVMKDLSYLKRLRFLSFQGISNVKRLSRSACKLTTLIILDLRGCDNLEELPERIHRLKNLAYLDLTGCKALESIPVGLASLWNLEVLKGFVVGDDREIACKLNDIKRLSKLRKLSVTVDREGFDLHELIMGIEEGFDALEKLKVWWGSGFSLSKKHRDSNGKVSGASHRLPKRLKKLDLQRFPDSKLPFWLWPNNILGLEKLHLGSSRRLKGFSESLPEVPSNCSVKVLRLKCLPKLRVEWRELKYLYFPNLNFLESYECPRVTFCPCDRDGIWRSDECV